jgi:hypothetical protein
MMTGDGATFDVDVVGSATGECSTRRNTGMPLGLSGHCVSDDRFDVGFDRDDIGCWRSTSCPYN